MKQFSNELNKIKSSVSDTVWEALCEFDAIIGGGAITSVFCNRDINDLDIYLRSEGDFFGLIEYIYDSSNFSLIAANMTDRSILFRDRETEQDVQLIVYKFFKDANELFNDYDFTVNMGALNCKTEQFEFHDEFFKHNSQRYLQFHVGTTYPLISALRVQKYIDKGYSISKAQMLRILLTISALKLNSWDDIKDHCGGFYGLNMDEVFPEDKEFTLELAIETLDNVFGDNKFKTYFREISQNEIIDKFFENYHSNDLRVSSMGKYFKNVKDDGNGIYSSTYKKEFKYEVDKVVNGGANGIYFYEGYEVLTGIYNEYANGNVILELELSKEQLESTNKSFNKLCVKGDVKVIGVYTKLEFFKKFKKEIKQGIIC